MTFIEHDSLSSGHHDLNVFV